MEAPTPKLGTKGHDDQTVKSTATRHPRFLIPMPKLHLKRTPAEEEERAQRKARKSKRKEAKRLGQKYDLNGSSSTSTRDNHHRSKRRATDTGEDANYDTDYESDDRLEWLEEQHHRKREEEEFQERLWDELGQQERLDNLTSNMDSYPHIPQRWKSDGVADLEDAVYNDPNLMDDEHYAEWVRQGMWKYVMFIVCECCFPSRKPWLGNGMLKHTRSNSGRRLRRRPERNAPNSLPPNGLGGRLARPTDEGGASGRGNAERSRTPATTMRPAGKNFCLPAKLLDNLLRSEISPGPVMLHTLLPTVTIFLRTALPSTQFRNFCSVLRRNPRRRRKRSR